LIDRQYSYQPGGTVESETLSFTDIIKLFLKKLWVFVIVFGCVVAVAAVLAFVYPPIYKVSGALLVRPSLEKPFLFTEESSRVSQTNTKVSQEAINTAVNLITSTGVLKYVIAKRGEVDMTNERAVAESIAALRGSIAVNPISLSNLINVEYSGGNPKGIVNNLNELLDAFVRFNIEVQGIGKGGIKFFENQTADFKDQFNNLTTELIEQRLDGNVISPDHQQDNFMSLIRDLEGQRIELSARLADIGSRIAFSRAAINNVDSKAEYVGLPSELLQSYPSLIEMEKTLAQLIINKQRAVNDFKNNTKQVRDANSQYLNMRKQIGLFIHKALKDLEQQSVIVKSNVDAIRTRINDFHTDSAVVSANVTKLELIEMEHTLVKDNYRLYGKKLEEARINFEKDKEQFSNVSIVTRPTLPLSPWFPKRGMIVALSIPLGLLLAFLATVIAINWERSLVARKKKKSAFSGGNIPVLGSFELLT
jgi:uncharacterized protein involved in exopolysaccharide biosynthesis